MESTTNASRPNQASAASASRKRAHGNGPLTQSQQLLRAKQELDKAMPFLTATPDLLNEAVQLRDRLLDRFVELEKRGGVQAKAEGAS